LALDGDVPVVGIIVIMMAGTITKAVEATVRDRVITTADLF
jgi:hypothetical protein